MSIVACSVAGVTLLVLLIGLCCAALIMGVDGFAKLILSVVCFVLATNVFLRLSFPRFGPTTTTR